MKKSGVIISLLVISVLIISIMGSISLVSASWFGNVWKIITGKTTSEEIEVEVTIINDLNGDGFNETVTNTGIIGSGNISDNIIAFSTGDYPDHILKYYDINTDTLTNTEINIGRTGGVSISNNIIAFSTSHPDYVLKYYDINTDTLTNTEINIRGLHLSISNNVIAFSTSYPYILRYYDINTDTLVNTEINIEPIAPSISNNIIAFSTGHPDYILKYYDINTDTLVNTEINILGSTLSISDNIIVFSQEHILEYYDINTDTLVNTEINRGGRSPSISNNIIAFSTGGDYSDGILKYYDINTDTLINTEIDTGWLSPSVSNNIIVFSNSDGELSYLTLSEDTPLLCDSSHLSLCTDLTSCTNAEGHWYNSVCNSQAQETQTTTTTNGGGGGGGSSNGNSYEPIPEMPGEEKTVDEEIKDGIETIKETREFVDENGNNVEIESNMRIEADGSSVREEERTYTDKSGNEVKITIKSEIKIDGTVITDEKREFVNKDGNLIEINLKIESKEGSIKIRRWIIVEGKGVESELEIFEKFEDGEVKLKTELSNGNEQEIKIMPNRASEIALEKLKIKNFDIELKEVGKKDKLKAVYVAEGKKSGKFLGLFKVKLKLEAQIDSETGEVISLKKPWWAFLVIRLSELEELASNETNMTG